MNGIQGIAERFNFPLVDSFTGIVAVGGYLCLADLRRGGDGRFSLNFAGEMPLEGNNPFSPEVTAQLTRLARENNLRGRTAAMLAAGRGLRVKIIDMPRMERGELVASLRFTEADASPYSLEEAGLDGVILPGGKDGRMPVLMAALEHGEAARYHQSVSLSPFRPIALTVIPAALDALLEHSRIIDTAVPVLFLSISNMHTGIYIYEGGGIRFARDIAFGGGSFIDALSGEYEAAGGAMTVSPPDAKTLAAFFGVPRGDGLRVCGPHGIRGEAALARMQPALDRLVIELGRSLDYYRNEFQRDAAPAVYLVGSAAGMENLDGYLADALGCRVQVYNPFHDFVSAEGACHDLARLNGAAYAVAVGVALDRGRRINLLPEKLRWSARNWLRARLPAAAAVLCVVLAAALAMAGTAYRNDLDVQIAAAENKIAAFKQVHEADIVTQSAVNGIREEIGRIDARKASYPELDGRGVNWRALYAEVSRLTPDDVALDRLVFRFDGKQDAAVHGAAHGMQALFEGRVRGGSGDQVKTLERFLGVMRGSTHFSHVMLVSTRVLEEGGNSYLKFAVGADIKRGEK